MNNQLAIRDDMSLSELGQVFVKSGFFSDSRDASQAIVKVLAGRELGFGPIASMTGINVIQGRISLSANIIGAAIKRSGRYNYRVRKMETEVCEIEFFERDNGKWETIGLSTFTKADAGKAGTKNMDKYPRNMLYARAMSNGARWYCPDIFGGAVYTPEELGAEVNEEGEVIDAPAVSHNGHKAEPVIEAVIDEPPAMVQEALSMGAVVVENGKPPLRLHPDALKKALAERAATITEKASDKQRGLVAGVLNEILSGTGDPDESRHQLLKWLTGKASLNDVDGSMVIALLKWLNPTKDSGGAYMADPMAAREAMAALVACQPAQDGLFG